MTFPNCRIANRLVVTFAAAFIATQTLDGPLFADPPASPAAQPADSSSNSKESPPAPGAARAGDSPPPAAPPPAAPPAWSRRPYRLRLSLGHSEDASFVPAFREELAATIGAGIDRKLGPAVVVEWVDATGRADGTARGLDRLTDADLAERPGDYDQTLFVAIDRVGPMYRVSGRAWNATIRRLGAVESVQSFDRRALGDAAVGLVNRMFAPLAEIIDATEDGATLVLRAGEFSNPDPDDPQVKPGDVLQPFYRHLDKQGDVKLITPMPWTFLVVRSVEGGTVKTSLATGVRVALGAKRPRNVELMATVVRPARPATTLTLVPRGDRAHPLIAHPVVVEPVELPGAAPVKADPAQVEPDAKEPNENAAEAVPGDKASASPLARLLTDRSGRVTVTRSDVHPLVWLKIFSGEQLLAKVPSVPGLHAVDTLELPDDSIRLSVEGELELVKGRLVDTVARRATTIARIRSLAKAEDWKAVDDQLGRLDKLPDIKEFETHLSTIRVPAIEAATKRKDRLLEARVRQLTSDAQQLIRRYLDPDKIRELKEELAELRSLNLKGELKEKPAAKDAK